MLSAAEMYVNDHRRGNDFLVGEKNLNDFSVREAKIGEKQSRQSNSEYNFVQCVFFEKGVRSVQWGLGQSPRSWGIFENFGVKSNLTVCKLHKNGGAGYTSLCWKKTENSEVVYQDEVMHLDYSHIVTNS